MSLEKVGLTRQMVEDLPEDAQEKILAGHLSPVLPLTIRGKDGMSYEGRGRFSLFMREDGTVSARIHPVMEPIGETLPVAVLDSATGRLQLKEIPAGERYSRQVIDQLKEGKVVLDYLYLPDGQKQRAFLQLDEETQQIIGVPSQAIGQNLQAVSLGLDLSSSEDACLQNGHLVSFSNDDDEMLTVGLDLQSPTGIRFAVGDEKKWKEGRKRDWDKYELGVNGCWMTDDDGNLQYVSDEEFDEYDIWNEVEKQRERKSRNEPVHRGMPLK